MHTYTISKVKTAIEKDPTLGIISKLVTYHINHDSVKNISMLGSLSHVFPDQVEIKTNHTDNEYVINSITHTVNQIAPKEYTINKCPLCGSQLIHFVNTHVCINVNCFVVEQRNVAMLCLKLITLFPAIPSNLLADTVSSFNENKPMTLINVIKFIKTKHRENPEDSDIRFISDVISNLQISNLFNAAMGSVFSREIALISEHYNHSLRAVLKDVDIVFENLYHMCDERLRIILVLTLRENKELIDLSLQ